MVFSVVVPVSGRPIEPGRVQDLVESLAHYERRASIHLVIIDDSLTPRNIRERCKPGANCKIHEIQSPRMGRGAGWGGGSMAGMSQAMRWVHEHTDSQFVLKVDTDSLFIGPFSDSIARAFERMPAVGMVGSNRRSPRGPRQPPAEQPVAPVLRKLMKPVAFWLRRQPWRGIQFSSVGRWRKIRDVLRLAVRNGYEVGDFVHGGGYAIRREALAKIHELGLFRDPLMWIETSIPEDVVMSIYVQAAGYRFADLVDDGDPFAVQTIGLLDSPKRLVERGFGIVHAVKGDTRLDEDEVRREFRLIRASENA